MERWLRIAARRNSREKMTALPETRHSLLVRLSKPDDVEAWTEFMSIYQLAIFQYARSRGLQEADAWEVVQQVLVLIHQKIGDWQATERPGAFRAWLMRTSHRVCQQVFREMTRRAKVVKAIAAGRPCAAGGGDVDESLDCDRWALCYASEIVRNEVSDAAWDAFWLTAVAMVSPKDVAARLRMKIGAVYTAKCRVLARIRQVVRELSEVDR